MVLNTPRLGDSTTSMRSLFGCLTTLSVEKLSLSIKSKPPLAQLEAVCPLLFLTWQLLLGGAQVAIKTESCILFFSANTSNWAIPHPTSGVPI